MGGGGHTPSEVKGGEGMKRPVLITDNGKKIEVTRIGRGQWSTAYRHGRDVYLVTRESKDYSKHIMAEAYRRLPSNRHLPHIREIERLNGSYRFKMPFYPRLMSKDDKAWRTFKDLRELANRVWMTNNFTKDGWMERGYSLMCSVRDKVKDRALRNALDSIIDASMDYAETYWFEFSPRNLGVGSKGQLVLMDPIYNMYAVWSEREDRMMRLRGGGWR
jgi:hypothetical protein